MTCSLRLTRKLQRRNLTFASVHDSYWTHACDVDEMSTALRDCFVELHSRDLLGDLKRDVRTYI